MVQLLERINEPHALKSCTLDELSQLARELRRYIIDTVSQTGGHLAPSLGTVELTLALHRAFDCPEDKIVWDVGHQAYAHKILTGRREAFAGLRQKGGITGFPKREESVYDAFGTGHSSTSISAALGMAAARDIAGEQYRIAAVIGDGALTGGEAFEGLNNAGTLGKDIIVILNDNGMSIAPNVGAMSEYLSRFRVAPGYHRAKQDIKNFLKSIPHIGERVYRTAEHIKDGVRSALVPGGLFTDMGFHYIGPLDGHNIALLLDVFEQAKQLKGPLLIHVETCKGKGYAPAEKAPDKFHGIGKFDVADGTALKKAGAKPTYTSVFSKALMEAAEEDADVVAITAAMPDGTGLRAFSEKYPTRFFDVGIAEQHATTFAAGLAAAGRKPVLALYSTFAQRAYDQILHDVCLQNLHVVFALDRAGFVGEDGATHHGVFDYSYLRHLPNMKVLAPKDENELGRMLKTALSLEGPVALRYPRGEGLGAALEEPFNPLESLAAEVLEEEGEIALLAVGSMVDAAQKTAKLLKEEGLSAAVINMRTVKPLDEELLHRMAHEKKMLVTMEENALAGGFGSAVLEALADAGLLVPVVRFGIGDAFIEQGKPQELLEMAGLLPEQMARNILTAWKGARDGEGAA
ncbi:1-deoxy-D-xylulose-5-phosphate synthase [uncultured Selenomonas sp.]|uniref:1-deoxy-D-xylulose-5-phosphate synthase n=1 Tax=uncultured Selenomonas sp. TaxID=159275 RepID=UPI0028D61833|nr:1-deoxy-D-xylulose-5-phosphate synthase [uncultured Selenomonas sp.]